MPDFDSEQFDKVIAHLQVEFAKLRTGRANAALVQDLKADYYGTSVAINTIGSITIPEPRQLVVTPWDKNALAGIEKAIRSSGFGLNPVNEGDKIRINIPPLTEERRKELTKIVSKLAEEARVKIRNIREEIWKDIQQKEQKGMISEDDKFRLKDELQNRVDDYNKKIKETAENKEKEIMTI